MTILENITFDELKVGDRATITRVLTDKELILFAVASGDVNPVHLDDSYAAKTPFKERIAHGIWSGSLISAAIATSLPGPGTVYLSQSLQFLRPVKLADTLTVTLTVIEKRPEKSVAVLDCEVINQAGQKVVKGLAEVKAPTKKIVTEATPLPDIEIIQG